MPTNILQRDTVNHQTLLILAKNYCVQALIELNGRYFGGNVVSGDYYDEDRFDTSDLAPDEAEIRAIRGS